ncbi:MAG: hypothetical protein KKC46_09880 [Proteobacteria bacterium]|nr:hypothetical protein [Pseudomonadota bacterium]
MKINTILILFLLVMILIFPSILYSDEYSSQHQKVVKLFESDEEPTTKDALWTASNIFKVGVFNDGTNRNGYAQYVCQVLYNEGFKDKKVWVQVIDIGKLNSTGKWIKLGEAQCN